MHVGTLESLQQLIDQILYAKPATKKGFKKQNLDQNKSNKNYVKS